MEVLLKDKKRSSGKNFGHLLVTNKVFVSGSLCPYYRFIWSKCKDLQRQGKVHHVFCLGGIVCLKLSENGSPAKLHHIRDIPNFPLDSDIESFCKYGICSVNIAKYLSFFRCEAIFIIFPRKLIVTSLPPTPLLFTGFLPRTREYFIDCRRFILIPRWLQTKRCDASNFKKSVAT